MSMVSGKHLKIHYYLRTLQPANGEELGSVPAMSQAEVDEVYAAAKVSKSMVLHFHMLKQ